MTVTDDAPTNGVPSWRRVAGDRFPRAVRCQKFIEHGVRGVQMMLAKRGGEGDHPVMPLVTRMQQRDPVKRIGKQPSHAVRFGVP